MTRGANRRFSAKVSAAISFHQKIRAASATEVTVAAAGQFVGREGDAAWGGGQNWWKSRRWKPSSRAISAKVIRDKASCQRSIRNLPTATGTWRHCDEGRA